MPVILQTALPAAQSGAPRLPGTMPCAADDWLRVDEAYAAQMAYRSSLLADRPQAVLREDTKDTGLELLQEALRILPALGFRAGDRAVTCPDGREVMTDMAAPLHTLGHLVQEDICILEKQGDEHVMTSAVLCFPANWRLAEKIGRPLTGIHEPVDEYDDNIARRVQRLFDGVRVGKPLWRFNKLPYVDADLHQPYKRAVTDRMPFVRSERQCILRLPRTEAVIFTIHTYVIPG
ncbi:MAG: heme-dependent oxidative N-demethylase family protein [Yoonia sp.]